MAVVLCLVMPAVWAALGQRVADSAASTPVGQPSARMQTATPALRFSVQTSVLPSGTQIQEFVDTKGVVFAVAWRGPLLPDLKALLGQYFPLFALEMQRTRQSGNVGNPVALSQSGLVMRSNGRMRHFSGDAYAPSLVPADVNIREVLP